jgi:hypothetical protein
MPSPIIANAAASAQGASGADPVRLDAMGPRELLAFTSSVAQQLDGEVQTSINGMRETSDAASRISSLRAEVGDLSQTISSDGTKRDTMVELSDEQIAALDPEVRDLLHLTDEKRSVSIAMLDKADTQLELRQNEINSNQQLRMLAIQESMRQRSELVQLVSNILREHAETDKAIVRNIQ